MLEESRESMEKLKKAKEKKVMTGKNEIYCNILENSSEPQRSQRIKKPKKKRPSCFKHKDLISPSSWKLIAMILVITCLALLLTVGLLATAFFSKFSLVNQKSFHSEEYPVNGSSYKETNKRVWNYTCSRNWHQHGENCYHFSKTALPGEECEAYCMSLFSRFLKVITEEEMNFVMDLSKIQYYVQKGKFSVGLYYNIAQQKWVWKDGTDFTLHKFKILGHVNEKTCGYIIEGVIIAEDCQSNGYCICKKTIYFS